MRAWLAGASILVWSGCGLVLDLDPGGVDAGKRDRVDAGRAPDAGAPDGRVRLDASPTVDASPQPAMDATPACPEPCRLVAPQCGCGAGEACQVTSTSDPHCETAGTGAAGTYCMAETDCRAGLTCVWRSGTRDGVCVAFCDDDADCGDPRAHCVDVFPTDQAGACSFPCDPLDATTCPDDVLGCDVLRRPSFMDGTSVDVTMCRTTGFSADGEPCTGAIDCAAGTTCVSGTCRTLCRARGTTACSGGRTCVPMWSIAGEEYGVCGGA